jgi:iron complex transport system ATP-binding protein
VELCDVSLWRGPTRILDGVNWRVESGGRWAIIGPNGCGKTTLLNVVSGWLFPSSGRANVLGRTFGACDMGELRREIGWVSNTVAEALPPRLTTLGVVLSGLDAELGVRRDPAPAELAAAREHLKQVGCAHRAELPFSLLSTGERVRALIARALIRAPRLLILDEPCTGLDPVARDAFLAMLERFLRAQPGLAVLFVTHHLEEIVPAVAHVLALRAGRVVAAGAKRRVLTAPTLAAVFGHPFRLRCEHGRYVAHPALGAGSPWVSATRASGSGGRGSCARPGSAVPRSRPGRR